MNQGLPRGNRGRRIGEEQLLEDLDGGVAEREAGDGWRRPDDLCVQTARCRPWNRVGSVCPGI
jgi:hypothetical protein